MRFTSNVTAEITSDDYQNNSIWILNSAFVIITMQSGFGLLESGFVSKKNEVNIMVKNVVDITLGGIMFWSIGYSLGFGESEYSNAFSGWGNCFFDVDNTLDGGWNSAWYFFQLTFSTTATTIVSGALAERCRFRAYCLFSLINTIIYCIAAHWVFSPIGWLRKLGVVDFAGAGPVHLLGGTTALVGSWILKPRHNRSVNPSSLVNSLLGLFLVWWGWLGFNCGSSFGVTGNKWILVARAASATLNASIGGSVAGLVFCSFVKKHYDVYIIVNSIISALVAITPSCAFVANWSSIFIGMVASILYIYVDKIVSRFVDDPIGCVASHGFSAVWGLIATGLFTNVPSVNGDVGLFYSGSFRLLGVQCVEIISIIAWSALMSFFSFKLIDKCVTLRLTEEEEAIGNDALEHLNNVYRVSPRAPEFRGHDTDDIIEGVIQV